MPTAEMRQYLIDRIALKMCRRCIDRLIPALVVLWLILPCPCSHAQSVRRQVVLVVADGLTSADIPTLDSCLDRSVEIGLISPGRPLGPDPVASEYATLGAGDSIGAGEVSEGRLRDALRSAGRHVAAWGTADGDDTGIYRPLDHFLPAPDVNLPAVPGSVTDPLVPGGMRIDPAALADATAPALSTSDVVAVYDGDLERLDRENRAGDLLPTAASRYRSEAVDRLADYLADLAGRLRARNVRLYVVGAAPVASWDHLTPLIVADFPLRTVKPALLMSPTTRTPGLIAGRDIAPSILSDLGVGMPIQMTGAAIRGRPAANPRAVIADLDSITSLDQQLQEPFFWVFGCVGGFTVIALILIAVGRGRSVLSTPQSSALSLYGLRVVCAWSLALLAAPLAHPSSVAAYLAWIGIAALAAGLLPSPAAIAFVTAVAVVVDGFFGSPLVARTILSGYAMAGIRFYGIGNEYMGVLIGGALMAPLLLPNMAASPRLRLLGLWFALVVFVLSFPAFGAKAGGAITATATFLFALWELAGVRVNSARTTVAIIAGFGLVFAWGLISPRLGLAPSHIDTAVSALAHSRFGYIVGVALRKAGMAVRVLLHPGTLAGLVGLACVGWFAYRLLDPRIKELLERDRKYRAVAAAGLRGCVVAILFNDSGIVAAIMMFIAVMLPALYNLAAGGLSGEQAQQPVAANLAN